jgi:hypothetical protein
MSSWKIVLIDKTAQSEVPLDQLRQIADALQQQVDNDFAPIWGVRADISAPAPGDVIPPDALPVNVIDSLAGAGGVHLDNQGNPYAEAVKGPGLSISISHEVLEMLADPWGNRFVLSPDIDPAYPGRQVFYLVEVCDPCEVSSYPIGDVPVSDFVFPAFYDKNGVAPFDHCGTLTQPLPALVPHGCYISWIDPADWKWHQQAADGTFDTADVTLDSNPRADRDKVFGDLEEDRHNIPAILQKWPAG